MTTIRHFVFLTALATTAACIAPDDQTGDESDESLSQIESASSVYAKCWDVPLELDSLCTEWTGGYPTGSVWATGSRPYYGIKLQVCVGNPPGSGDCTSFLTVPGTAEYGHTMTSHHVKAGKSGWYRACGQLYEGGRWTCEPTMYAVYLGD